MRASTFIFSHNLKLGDGLTSIALGAPLALLFIVGDRGPIWSLPFYWVTIVAVRASGTVVGELIASHGMLSLPLSTAVTGIVAPPTLGRRSPQLHLRRL